MPGLDTLAGQVALGIDIVDADRLRRLVNRWGDAFLDRVFTPVERNGLQGPRGIRWDSLAGRYAAKEAVRKVFGARGAVPRLTDIEVGVGEYGQPLLTLLGTGADLAEQYGFRLLLLSIAHEKRAAVAVVLAL